MKKIQENLTDMAIVSGAIAIIKGVSIISAPAAWIVLGAFMIFAAVKLEK